MGRRGRAGRTERATAIVKRRLDTVRAARSAVHPVAHRTTRGAPHDTDERPAHRTPGRASRRPSATAVAAVFAALALAAGATACDGAAARAWDCAKTAATIAGDVQDLESTATNIGQVSEDARRQDTVDALDKLQSDLDTIGRRDGDGNSDKDGGSATKKAVSRLSDSVHTARDQAQDGRTPDLKPVASAAGHFTDVCAGA